VVVTKIVKVGMAGEALLQSITKYTNSQNAVREKDFTALGSDFKTWQRQMEDQHHVYLEVQRGGWDSRKAFQNQHPKMPQLHEYANAFDLIKVYGAGWLREAGTAFGRNAAFVPAGTIFRRIMSPEPNDTAFGLDDLYAAYQLQKAADEYKFGRRGPTSRRQTRFLFYMVVLDLLRGVLISANKPHQLKDLTNTLLTVFAPGNEAAATALLETAVKEVIDVYLNSGEEDSVFNEPAYVGRFNNDLNGFLKWDLLGKNEESTPHYSNLIAFTRRAMGRATAGQPSPRDIITKVLTSA
jgi:hypothetical protein